MEQSQRKRLIGETKTESNKERKDESLSRFEIFNGRQSQYIMEKLEREFDSAAVLQMRKVLSINISKRIIGEQSSIYKKHPDRIFGDATDAEIEQLDAIYRHARADFKMRLANEYYKLYNDQIIMQIIPKEGIIQMRPLLPHNYDVIPDPNNPEKALGYILHVHDKWRELSQLKRPDGTDKLRSRATGIEPDDTNQSYAEADDYKSLAERYIVWTDDLHFEMNGLGEIVGEEGEDITNPIGKLPFVDIANQKDNEFFRRFSSNVTDFAIEFGVCLSDISNISRLQSYAQAVITSENKPEFMVVGPQNVLWLKQDPNPDAKDPKFEFVTPNADLDGALNVLETTLRIFLSSEGLDTSTVGSQVDASNPNSGIQQLLSMIERFEASQQDVENFRDAEGEQFDIFKRWSNRMQGVNGSEFDLIDDLKRANISDDVSFNIKYAQPQLIQTKKEIEESAVFLLDKDLASRVETIMEIREVDEDAAIQVIERIDKEKKERAEKFSIGSDLLGMGGINGGTDIQEKQSEPEDQS